MSTELLPNLIITKINSASTLYTPQNAKGKRVDRQSWALLMKFEGETHYLSGGRQFLADHSHVLILPKGCSYEWHCTKAGHFSVIEFDCESSSCGPVSISLKSGEKILGMCRDMEYKRNLKMPTTELESIRDMYSILLELTRAEAARYLPTEKQKKITPAIEYISEHYRENITNDTLARVAGLSTVYFRKLFTAAMGVSPMAYARHLRIEKAKEILRSDYATLADVALSLGYSSLFDFSRDFKKHTGLPPSKYPAAT